VKIEFTLATLSRKVGPFGSRYRVGQRATEPLRSHFVAQATGKHSGVVTITDYDGNLKLRIDRWGYMGSRIFWSGFHAHDEICVLRKLLNRHSVFVDAGANFGEFTIFAAKHAASVLAFEPLPKVYAALEENVSLNQFVNVRLFQLALGENSATLPMYSCIDGELNNNEGLSTLYISDNRSTQVASVSVEPFDDVFDESGYKRIDVFKVDVEGAEIEVLRGARTSIKRYRPVLLVELNSLTCEAAGYTVADLSNEIRTLDYEICHILRGGRLEILSGNPTYANVACFPKKPAVPPPISIAYSEMG